MARKAWAVQLATLAVVLGLLAQSVFGLPARFTMAQAYPICGVAHEGGPTDTPDRPVHAHPHCMLCQGQVGPPLLADAAQVHRPVGYAFAAHTGADRPWIAAHIAPCYQSRAPPRLA